VTGARRAPAWPLALLLVACLMVAPPARAQAPAVILPAGILIATEAMPVGDPLAPAPTAPPWATTEAVARQSALLVPEAARAAGVDAWRIEAQVVAGGAFLETAPMLLLRTRLGWAEAERLAAALGFVFRAPGVIVADLAASEGDSAFAIVALPQARPTPTQAHAFFERAARTTEGLGTSYLALAEGLLFLNLRDSDGTTLAGLDDENFLDALRDTATAARARLAVTGSARTRIVWNDWVAAPDGAEHLERLGPSAAPSLRALRERHEAIVRAAVRAPAR
jgi:hypothetical protein